MKASESVRGNQVLLVRAVMVCCDIVLLTASGRLLTMDIAGLYPRNAANSAPVGGFALRTGASVCAPMLWSEVDMTPGKEFVRPTMTMVKKITMLTEKAVFIMVDIIPDATPRSSGGTELMMDALFGEANIPLPMPMMRSEPANSQYWKSAGKSASNMNDSATISIPPVAIHLGPYLSDSMPDMGAMMIRPIVRGSMYMPAHRGVSA